MSKSKRNQSMTLENFILGIYSPNICFLNLQYGDTKDEISNLKLKHDIDIFDLKDVDKFNDIDDLTSLINACNIVVSIENITFALAGALGINSKILLKHNCHWSYGANDLKSYWLTNQSLFRQNSSGEWREAFSKVKNELDIFN